jgi:hypothetical protein
MGARRTPCLRRSAAAAFVFAAALASAFADVVDRIAVTVGKAALTESAIRQHVRLAAFVEGKPADESPAALRRAAARLADLVLLRREMEVSGFAAPPENGSDALYSQLRASRFPREGDWARALREAGLREADLRRHLRQMFVFVRFTESRFRPGVVFSPQDVEEYYRTRFLPGWEKHNPERPPPALDEVRDQMEAAVIDERVDGAIEDWLKAVRTQYRIVYRDEVFR